jgi:hypothetical protein
MELGIRPLCASPGHRTPGYIGSTDLRLEVIDPAGSAALDTQAGVLRVASLAAGVAEVAEVVQDRGWCGTGLAGNSFASNSPIAATTSCPLSC